MALLVLGGRNYHALLRMLPLRILPVSSFSVVLRICMRCIAMKWETPVGAISSPAPLPSLWGMWRPLHWLGSTFGGNRCQQRLRRKQFAWGHKIPLPLGFSSPEALYPKIDLNLSKGPFWGLAVPSPGPDQEPLQVAMVSTQEG